jgi:hypothetical protein
MRHVLTYCALSLPILVSVAPLKAEPAYLPASEISAGLADGQPWAMVSADGKNGRIRFDRNGTGAIVQPLSRNIKWSVDGNAFCMKLGFLLGTKCFQAVKTETGYQGYIKGKPRIRFSR